jgi:hypothetical protein
MRRDYKQLPPGGRVNSYILPYLEVGLVKYFPEIATFQPANDVS